MTPASLSLSWMSHISQKAMQSVRKAMLLSKLILFIQSLHTLKRLALSWIESDTQHLKSWTRSTVFKPFQPPLPPEKKNKKTHKQPCESRTHLSTFTHNEKVNMSVYGNVTFRVKGHIINKLHSFKIMAVPDWHLHCVKARPWRYQCFS